MEVDQLIEQLTSSPARLELLTTALEAAAHATLEEKIKALGRGLATGALGDDDEVDAELLFAHAMVDLDRPHLRILEHLRQPGRPDQRERERPVLTGSERASVPGIGFTLEPLIGTLQRHGAVEPHWVDQQPSLHGVSDIARTVSSAESWRITDWGRHIIYRLRSSHDNTP